MSLRENFGITYGPIRTASAIWRGVARSSGGAFAPGTTPPSATTWWQPAQCSVNSSRPSATLPARRVRARDRRAAAERGDVARPARGSRGSAKRTPRADRLVARVAERHVARAQVEVGRQRADAAQRRARAALGSPLRRDAAAGDAVAAHAVGGEQLRAELRGGMPRSCAGRHDRRAGRRGRARPRARSASTSSASDGARLTTARTRRGRSRRRRSSR